MKWCGIRLQKALNKVENRSASDGYPLKVCNQGSDKIRLQREEYRWKAETAGQVQLTLEQCSV